MDPTTIALQAVIAYLASIPAIGPALPFLPLLLPLCALIDALVPQPAAGSVWVVPRKLVSAIGFNFLHASNAVQPGALPASVSSAADGVISAIADVKAASAGLAGAATAAEVKATANGNAPVAGPGSTVTIKPVA